jgi:hypothetical protein
MPAAYTPTPAPLVNAATSAAGPRTDRRLGQNGNRFNSLISFGNLASQLNEYPVQNRVRSTCAPYGWVLQKAAYATATACECGWEIVTAMAKVIEFYVPDKCSYKQLIPPLSGTRHQRCRPPVLKMNRFLTGYENSLLYSILCPLSRNGVLTGFDSF